MSTKAERPEPAQGRTGVQSYHDLRLEIIRAVARLDMLDLLHTEQWIGNASTLAIIETHHELDAASSALATTQAALATYLACPRVGCNTGSLRVECVETHRNGDSVWRARCTACHDEGGPDERSSAIGYGTTADESIRDFKERKTK